MGSADRCFSLTKRNWVYRGEGNSNIVLSLPDEKMVLRLRKSLKGKLPDLSQMEKKLWMEIKFISSVMRSLLRDVFVTVPTVISLSRSDVEMVNTALESQRPANRCHKDLFFHLGTLFPDFSYLPLKNYDSSNATYCVELKPKQGVFPMQKYTSKKCAFCLKQFLKLKEGLAQEKSSYCPLDLFSGDSTRMKHAIISLLQTPQNNLRILRNGLLVFGEGDSPAELQDVLSKWLKPFPGIREQDCFASLLLEVLTKELAASIKGGQSCSNSDWKWDGHPASMDCDSEQFDTQNHVLEKLPSPYCNFIQQPLPKGCILELLGQAQGLCMSSPTEVYALYISYLKDKGIKKSSLADEEYGYIESILQKGCSSLLSPIESYLISATARDCSLLISFQEITDPEAEIQLPIVTDVSLAHLAFNIAVVDLDPKPLSCIERHHFRDEAIDAACKEAIREKS